MKTLSNILLLFNAFNLFVIFGLWENGYWYLLPLDFFTVYLILKFHFSTHKEEYEVYGKWRKNFEKEWTYLGDTNDYYREEVWQNKQTGELIYI